MDSRSYDINWLTMVDYIQDNNGNCGLRHISWIEHIENPWDKEMNTCADSKKLPVVDG